MNMFYSKYEEFDTKTIIFNGSVNEYDIISQKDLSLSSTINNDIQFEAMKIGEILKSEDFSSNNLDILSNFINSGVSNNPSKNLIIEINEKNHEQNHNFSTKHLSQKKIGSREVRFKIKTTNTGSINTKKKKYSQENNQKSFIKKRHSAKDDDNILRKIQVHYLSFVVSFVNDVIKSLFPKKNLPDFKNIDYEIKKRVSHKYIEEMKKKTIGEVLQLRVSPKLKNSGEKANKEIYDIILKNCPEIEGLFELKYISFFEEYYFKDNINLCVNNKIIKISNKTKRFTDLCKKYYCYKGEILKVAFSYYLNCHKRSKKPKFISKIAQD